LTVAKTAYADVSDYSKSTNTDLPAIAGCGVVEVGYV
jgi:hypothetical protein